MSVFVRILCRGEGGSRTNTASYAGASPIPSTFFGMHISNTVQGRRPPHPWPIVRVPAWRLWDAGVTWPNLEPAKGQWEFSVLDKSLAIAQENHTEVMLTLGFTPVVGICAAPGAGWL